MTFPQINAVGINESGEEPAPAQIPPLINGAVINGAVINGGAYSAPYVAGSPVDFTGAASSLQPTVFGVPGFVVSFVVGPLQPTVFGVPDYTVYFGPVESLTQTRFGMSMVLYGVSPPDADFQVKHMKAARFGTAALSSTLQTGPAQSLQTAKFGVLTLYSAMHAPSLSPSSFGAPSATASAYATSLRPAQLGAAHTAYSLASSSLRRASFGALGLRLIGAAVAAQGLHSIQFGTPTLSGVEVRPKAMCPARFGRPTLDRGTAC